MPETNEHPSAITDEQRAALVASDPAAFDEDVPDTTEAERAASEKAEAEKAEVEKAEAEAKKPDMIPKGRLNEVLAERDRERERAEALAAELEALKKGPPVDYDAEVNALDKAWNEDDFEGSHEDYLNKRDGLIAARAEQAAIEKYEQMQAEREAQKAAEAWASAANAFVEAHPEYTDAASKAELEAALHGVFAKFPDASDSEKLERAHKIVLALNGKDERGPHNTRNAADASAASKAAAQPPMPRVGAGNRSAVDGEIDYANLKPGQFGKLTKEQQAAALGSPDAL